MYKCIYGYIYIRYMLIYRYIYGCRYSCLYLPINITVECNTLLCFNYDLLYCTFLACKFSNAILISYYSLLVKA